MSNWTLLAEVPSSSKPNTTYRVAVDGHGRLGCSCPSRVFGRERRCKHLTKLAIACIPLILDGLAELNALKAKTVLAVRADHLRRRTEVSMRRRRR